MNIRISVSLSGIRNYKFSVEPLTEQDSYKDIVNGTCNQVLYLFLVFLWQRFIPLQLHFIFILNSATADTSDSKIGVIVGVTVSMVTVVIILIVMVFYCKRGKNKVKIISTERPRQKQIAPPAKPKEQPSDKLTENKSTNNQKEESASVERTQINRLSHDSGIIGDILSDHFTDNQMLPHSTACQWSQHIQQ